MADEAKMQWERLPELFAYVEWCEAQGLSQEDIAVLLQQIDQYEWDCVVAQALAEGTTQEEIDAWTAALLIDIGTFEDDDPEDAIDAGDPGYVEQPSPTEMED